MSEYPDCGGRNFLSTDVWEPENSTDSGTFNLYTGTQKSVNTFYAQLEKGATFPWLQPIDLGKGSPLRMWRVVR